jgi:hypothetical protein
MSLIALKRFRSDSKLNKYIRSLERWLNITFIAGQKGDESISKARALELLLSDRPSSEYKDDSGGDDG